MDLWSGLTGRPEPIADSTTLELEMVEADEMEVSSLFLSRKEYSSSNIFCWRSIFRPFIDLPGKDFYFSLIFASFCLKIFLAIRVEFFSFNNASYISCRNF